MFIEKPILSGIGLMMTCFVAFMAQASLQYDEESRAHYQTYIAVQEVDILEKQKKKPKVCAKNLQKQQKEIADELKEIKKQLKKLKK
jgi:hypothetical protein